MSTDENLKAVNAVLNLAVPPVERLAIRRMYLAGQPVSSIARKLGRSVPSVTKYAMSIGRLRDQPEGRLSLRFVTLVELGADENDDLLWQAMTEAADRRITRAMADGEGYE